MAKQIPLKTDDPEDFKKVSQDNVESLNKANATLGIVRGCQLCDTPAACDSAFCEKCRADLKAEGRL